LPGTYVGDGLELTDIIVERGRVWSVRHRDAVSVPDAFLLGDLTTNQAAAWASAVQSRLVALFLLAVFWPLLPITALFLVLFRRKPLLHRHSFVRLPSTLDARDWQVDHFTTFPTNAGGHCALPVICSSGANCRCGGEATVGRCPTPLT
jgi:hypothetical protein